MNLADEKCVASPRSDARVVHPDDPTYAQVRQLVKRKYGLTAALITASGKVRAALGRPSRTAPDRVFVMEWA